MYIDIHAHLDIEPLYKNRLEIIKRAKEKEVKVIVTNGIDIRSNRITLELAKEFPIVKAACGIYPTSFSKKFTEENLLEEIDFIKKNKNKIIALGEIGLDYNSDINKKDQQLIFEKFLTLAEKLGKPVILHTRKAEQEVIETLETTKLKKIILHCFSGKKKFVNQAADNGYSFSVPANIVRSQHFQTLVNEVNINQLFTETDAPNLCPYKEQVNEPSYVTESAKMIAKIKKMTLEETNNNIYFNYMQMFQ